MMIIKLMTRTQKIIIIIMFLPKMLLKKNQEMDIEHQFQIADFINDNIENLIQERKKKKRNKESAITEFFKQKQEKKRLKFEKKK